MPMAACGYHLAGTTQGSAPRGELSNVAVSIPPSINGVETLISVLPYSASPTSLEGPYLTNTLAKGHRLPREAFATIKTKWPEAEHQ